MLSKDWNTKERQLVYNIFYKYFNTRKLYEAAILANAISKWRNVIDEIKKSNMEVEMSLKLTNILTNSIRGKRTTMEKEEIRKYIIEYLHCIPKTISFSEMDTLCNEIDWNPLLGKSIIFLQGDYGNVYYIIAKGRVGLYLEPSKDREMIIAREYGSLRSQKFYGTDEDLNKLGNNIFNLSKGSGFGEYAILASTNKIRSCAAVALDDECMLLVVHADTYNLVLKQHHYRQKQLSSATTLLQELPLFKHHNYSAIAAIAYTLKNQTYSNKTIIIRSGDIINNLLLINSGDIKVYSINHSNNDQVNNNIDNNTSQHEKNVTKRLPKLAIAVWSKGKIIGETELLKGLRHFELTYECSSSTCEIFEIPSTIFKESMKNNDNPHAAIVYKSLKETHQEKDELLTNRANRAYHTMKSIMINTDKEFKTKNDLKLALPILINPPTSTISTAYIDPILNGSTGTYGHHTRKVSISNTSDDVVVTRRSSFSIQLSNDNIESNKNNIHKNVTSKNNSPDNLKNNLKLNHISQSETISNTNTLSPTIPINKNTLNSSSPRKKSIHFNQ